jgi:hypothetical protein
MAQRSGLLAKIGPDHVFETTPAAVAGAQSGSEQNAQEQRATAATADPPGRPAAE